MKYQDYLVTQNNNLINSDKVEFRCSCGATGIKSVGHAVRSLKEHGFAYQCKACLRQKISDAKSIEYSSEFLLAANVVNTRPRRVRTEEIVEFFCRCGKQGVRKWADAVKANSLYGFYFQCPACRKENLQNRSNNPDWRQNNKLAAQSEAHKERARQNGKKRLELKQLHNITDYFDFSVDIQKVAGTDDVTAICKTCHNEITKPLKKLIEAIGHEAHGCSYCWDKVVSSNEYATRMKERSTPAGSESRQQQSQTITKNWNLLPEEIRKHRSDAFKEAYSTWATNNPDKLYSSKAELDILAWVQSLGLAANKHRVGGKEIDIFIPEKNIGLEYNGLYWHCEKNKETKYHKQKTDYFKAQGIRIIHVFEHIWRDRNAQVKSFLKAALGKNENRIGARKCQVVEMNHKEARAFAEQYHIQGASSNIKLAIGLIYKEEIVAVATFGLHHRDAKTIVLNRFVGREGWSVVGGLSKIMAHAVRFFNSDIITWADNSISEGSGYLKAGWVTQEGLPADYFYTDFTNVISKQSRKKKTVGTPEGMTEHQHSLQDGLFRIYDCGKTRMIFKKATE